MKHSIFYLSAAAALLLAGCSTDEDVTTTDGLWTDGNVIEVPIQVSDIPIVLNVNGSSTRGAVSEKDFECGDIGVFCLARKGIDGSSNTGIRWDFSSASANNNRLSHWLSNAASEVVWEGGISKLQWIDNKEGRDESYFYPESNSTYRYAYTFAAYHPMVDNEDVELVSNAVYMYYGGLDGSQDIFTAVGVEPTDQTAGKEGYSAAYFQSGGEQNPYFTFKHRMSRLNISLKLSDDYDGEDLFVDSVYITNMPDSMRVPLVTHDRTSGTVSEPEYVRVICGKLTTYFLRDGGDTYLSQRDEPYKLTASYQQIGDCIMIPPMQKGYMYIDRNTKLGNQSTITARMTLNLNIRLMDLERRIYKYTVQIAPPTDGWKQGSEYNIKVKISPKLPSTVSMSPEAELQDWTEDPSYFVDEFVVE